MLENEHGKIDFETKNREKYVIATHQFCSVAPPYEVITYEI